MKACAFLVDECLPFDVTAVLRSAGFDATDLAERGLRGISDAEVWKLAAEEARILVTRDLDFPLRGATPRPPGLVLLRAADDATAHDLAELVRMLVHSVGEIERLDGAITVVAPGRYRQRRW